MFKKLMSAVAAAALCVSLAACGATATSEAAAEATATPAPAVTEAPAEETASAETADGALRVAGLKGPTTMGLVNLMAGEDAADYDFEMYGKADEIVPQLVKGELDAAAVPANLAATLYQKTNGAIEVACINTLGVLYVVENGETVNSVEDLKGKTIVTTGKGTTPEYVLRYILTENGVDPDNDVTLDFYSEATEALTQLQAGTSTKSSMNSINIRLPLPIAEIIAKRTGDRTTWIILKIQSGNSLHTKLVKRRLREVRDSSHSQLRILTGQIPIQHRHSVIYTHNYLMFSTAIISNSMSGITRNTLTGNRSLRRISIKVSINHFIDIDYTRPTANIMSMITHILRSLDTKLSGHLI